MINIISDPRYNYKLECNLLNNIDLKEKVEIASKANKRLLNDISYITSHSIIWNNCINIWTIHPVLSRHDSYKILNYFYYICETLKFLFKKGENSVFIKTELPNNIHFVVKDICYRAGCKIYEDTNANSFISSNTQHKYKMNDVPDYKPFTTIQNVDVDIWFNLHERLPTSDVYNYFITKFIDDGIKVGFFSHGKDFININYRNIQDIGIISPIMIDVEDFIDDHLKHIIKFHKSSLQDRVNDFIQVTKQNNESFGFKFLISELENFSIKKLLRFIERFEAYKKFSSSIKKSIWVNNRSITLSYSRIITAAGKINGHTIISQAYRFYSKERLSNILIKEDFDDYNSNVVPDKFIVKDSISKTVLEECLVETNDIFVISDYKGKYIPNLASKPLSSLFSIFVYLQLPFESEVIVESYISVAQAINNLHLFFKIHPSFPLTDNAQSLISKHNKICSLVSSDDYWDKLHQAKLCSTIYSTAIFDGAFLSKPIIWCPWCSDNFIYAWEFYQKIGIVAYDENSLSKQICHLIESHDYYQQECSKSRDFFKNNFIDETHKLDHFFYPS